MSGPAMSLWRNTLTTAPLDFTPVGVNTAHTRTTTPLDCTRGDSTHVTVKNKDCQPVLQGAGGAPPPPLYF